MLRKLRHRLKKCFLIKTCSFYEINFSDEDLLKIIQDVDINKAHGHNNLFARMIRICDSAIIGPCP